MLLFFSMLSVFLLNTPFLFLSQLMEYFDLASQMAVSVTHVHGLVFARSLFNSSCNYQSVVAYGWPTPSRVGLPLCRCLWRSLLTHDYTSRHAVRHTTLHATTLHYTATHCCHTNTTLDNTTLLYTTLYSTALRYFSIHLIALQRNELHYHLPRYTARSDTPLSLLNSTCSPNFLVFAATALFLFFTDSVVALLRFGRSGHRQSWYFLKFVVFLEICGIS
jgi:hypothetical protein